MKKRNKLWCCIAIIVTMIAGLTGCGGNGNHAVSGNSNDDSLDTADGKSMGRYIETEYSLPEEMTRMNGLTKREDGTLVIFDYNEGMFQSEDEGKTWNKVEKSWFTEIKETEYIMDIEVSPKNGFAIISSPYVEENEEEDDYDLHPTFYYIDDEGNRTDFDIPYSGYEYVNRFFFDSEGVLYGACYGGKIYEINLEDGSFKLFYEAASTASDMVFIGDEVIINMREDLIVYNKEKKELNGQDEVLIDFIKKETPEDKYDYVDQSKLLLLAGEEENVIYTAFNKGLYRHIMGGNVMERIMDGSLCTLGEPSSGLVGMQQISEERFLILYSDKRLIEYHYDETVPTIPTTTLTAYSLRNNDVLRQAISIYQKKNPDVYVNYVVGMDSDSGITREDAIKKLNTEIMAGKGPDLLLLDNLNMDSYIEKGMLTDISPYLSDLINEKLLCENIVKIYQKDGAIYTLPAEFSIGMMTGDQDVLASIKDLKSLADAAESMRAMYPNGSIFSCYTEEGILKMLSTNNVPGLVMEDGSIDTEKLTEFLTQAKRIYQAEIAGIPIERREQFRKMWNEMESEMVEYMLDVSSNSFEMLTGEARMSVGVLSDFDWGFGTLVSLQDSLDHFGFAAAKGMVSDVFRPYTMAAINAKSDQQEMAGELIKILYSEENLNMSIRKGFAINKNSIENEWKKVNGYNGEVYGSMASTDEDGSFVTLDIRGATKEEFDSVITMIEQAKIPYAGYDVIENALNEIGPDALNGNSSVEDTVSQIMKKVAIYLAE